MTEALRKIQRVLDHEDFRRTHLTNDFLSLVLWKDYGSNLESPSKIMTELNSIIAESKDTGGDESYIQYDHKRMLALANKVRAAVGLPEVVNEAGHYMVKE